MLVDAVQASKLLSAKRMRRLTDKLLNMASRFQRADLLTDNYSDEDIKASNDTAYITIDILLKAINTKKQVRFMYYEYGLDKKKKYKHGRRCYEFSPWAIVWNSDYYYVIGYSRHHGKSVTFRIDRIAAPKLTTDNSVAVPEGFDIAKYIKSVYQMYDGPMMSITLKCENHMMKTIIDRFGEDVCTEIADDKHFLAIVNVAASQTFYGWVFAMDGAIHIISPCEAVSEFNMMLSKATACTIEKSSK